MMVEDPVGSFLRATQHAAPNQELDEDQATAVLRQHGFNDWMIRLIIERAVSDGGAAEQEQEESAIGSRSLDQERTFISCPRSPTSRVQTRTASPRQRGMAIMLQPRESKYSALKHSAGEVGKSLWSDMDYPISNPTTCASSFSSSLASASASASSTPSTSPCRSFTSPAASEDSVPPPFPGYTRVQLLLP